jgi:NAD(P)-dependent dehydrogenase (short-subunit alcohol dehydrogenase family)
MAAIAFARQSLGGLSLLVNNAGIAQLGSVEDLSLDKWRCGMSVNANSVFLGCKYALPRMRELQPDSIINIFFNLAAYRGPQLRRLQCVESG